MGVFSVNTITFLCWKATKTSLNFCFRGLSRFSAMKGICGMHRTVISCALIGVRAGVTKHTWTRPPRSCQQ